MRPSVPAEGFSEPLFFGPTPGPGDSDGGDVYPPGRMSGRFDYAAVASRLAPGGYEVVYETDRLQVGVYALAAPEPDTQSPHEWDELYFVLEGRGTLEVEDESFDLEEGGSVYVKAGAEHRFTGYEGFSVLVVFDKSQTA